MTKDKSKPEQAPRKPKRTWVTPRLTEHGSLKEITAKLPGVPEPNTGSFPGP